AWRNTSSSGGTFTAARLGQYSSGLGVSGTGGSDSDSDHEVDNIGTFDFVRLSFSQIVDVQSIRLEFVGSDSDLEVWFGNSGTLSTLYASASAVSLAGNGDDRTAFLDSANIIGQHMLIGAFTGGSNDSFKIRNITFNTTTNTVPDGGSTMLLLGVSLVGLGFAARRKKSV
ncbi:MAG: VPDSG-CTERM sorting domain-containing protein, partial [Opitutaceae bacterium]